MISLGGMIDVSPEILQKIKEELIEEQKQRTVVLHGSHPSRICSMRTFIDHLVDAVIEKLEEIEIAELDRMSEDLVDDYGCYDDIIHNAEIEQEFEIAERGYGRKMFEEGEE